jgi:transposase-like protein
MPAKKASAKGKRYTPEEKQKIIDFVSQYNATNGRGGASKASKEFGISPISLSNWLKKGTPSAATKKTTRAVEVTSSSRSKTLAELLKLDTEIAVKRKELAVLENRFQKLKEKV